MATASWISAPFWTTAPLSFVQTNFWTPGPLPSRTKETSTALSTTTSKSFGSTSSTTSPMPTPIHSPQTYTSQLVLTTSFSPPAACFDSSFTLSPEGNDTLITAYNSQFSTTWTTLVRGFNPACYPAGFSSLNTTYANGSDSNTPNIIYIQEFYLPGVCPSSYGTVAEILASSVTYVRCCPQDYEITTVLPPSITNPTILAMPVISCTAANNNEMTIVNGSSTFARRADRIFASPILVANPVYNAYNPRKSLSKGAVVGAIIGALFIVIATVIAIVALLARRKKLKAIRAKAYERAKQNDSDILPAKAELSGIGKGIPPAQELEVKDHPIYEADGTSIMPELDDVSCVHDVKGSGPTEHEPAELSPTGVRAELHGDVDWRASEPNGSGIKPKSDQVEVQSSRD